MVVSLKVPLESPTQHPFVVRASRHVKLAPSDIGAMKGILQGHRLVKKRSDIVNGGYKNRNLFFIETGVAVQYKVLPNGKRQILSLLLPGDVIGIPNAFFEYAIFSVGALSDMKIQVCPIDKFLSVCNQKSNLSLVLLWLAIEQSAIYAEHVVDAGRRSPAERILNFLLELYARLSELGEVEERTFEFPLSQDAIADSLGLSAPHVNRILRRLRMDGLVTIKRHKVTFLKDMDTLEALGSYRPARLMPL